MPIYLIWDYDREWDDDKIVKAFSDYSKAEKYINEHDTAAIQEIILE